jgi:predicted RNA-binding Zn ribbon-like protein
MEVVAHAFVSKDIVAGDPALDLVNTVTARDAATPRDWIDSYARLLEWAEVAGVLAPVELARLRALAGASPRQAAAELLRAKAFREALHELCSALIAAEATPAPALQRVDAVWRAALGRASLRQTDSHIDATLDRSRSGLNLPLDRLALHAIDLLRVFPAGRARRCAGAHCGWLFVDTSKGGRRVWCDMATCGNAAKSRRHQARQRRG